LLVQQGRAWVPICGEMQPEETPLEAAGRALWEEVGVHRPVFPHIHSVLGAPPGLLLYEEHPAAGTLVLAFAFIAEVPHKVLRSNGHQRGALWISSVSELPEGTPPYVQDAMPYALTAGVVG